ncbi:MAG: hypothetical protein ACTSRS_15565 [Candidatus Helarchaeota archaeon]
MQLDLNSIIGLIQIAAFILTIIIFFHSYLDLRKTQKYTGYTTLINLSNEIFKLSLEYPKFENPLFSLDLEKILELKPDEGRKYWAYINIRLSFCEKIFYLKNLNYIDEKTFKTIFEPLLDAVIPFHVPVICELLEFYYPDFQEYVIKRYKIKPIQEPGKKKFLEFIHPLPEGTTIPQLKND